MKRAIVIAGFCAMAGIATLQATPVIQNAIAPAPPKPAEPKPAAPAAPTMAKGDTPMLQRVATIGVLNKRNGLWRDLTMKPGEARRIGDVVVRLRACETTAPWEQEQYTGAFVQVLTRAQGTTWHKTFSGWLYKESPSLNVVEHPIYDVWVKECTMRHADTGPETIIARGDEGSGGSGRSSARKSASAQAEPVESVEDSAADSATE